MNPTPDQEDPPDDLHPPQPTSTHPPRPCGRAGLVVIIATTLVGGATGSLGGATTATIFAAVGLAWGALLTLAASLSSRTEPRRRAWAAGLVFATVLAAGLLTGSALFELLVMQAALTEAPSFFAELVRPPIGDAIVLPFYLLNTPLEWLLVPATLLLTWRVPPQRRLVLAAFVPTGEKSSREVIGKPPPGGSDRRAEASTTLPPSGCWPGGRRPDRPHRMGGPTPNHNSNARRAVAGTGWSSQAKVIQSTLGAVDGVIGHGFTPRSPPQARCCCWWWWAS
jgi:MFS family permease